MRLIIMAGSSMLALFFIYVYPDNLKLSIIYFVTSELLYLGFISAVLPENGLRKYFFKLYEDENEAYTAYVTILGFLFFHNAMSIGYISSAHEGSIPVFADREIIFAIVMVMFITGMAVKISAANVASIEIYFWKDMFLGRKISDFKVTGPYKYLKNPMYGVGQIQAYATALWFASGYGLIAAAVNQLLVFAFYFLVEKKFIERTYHNK